MAIAVLTDIASEESTYVVTGTFTDENDSSVTPDTLTWSLSNIDGTTVNNRSGVTVSSPAAATDVVLSGDDLALQYGESGLVRRRFTFVGTYTSSLGSGLPLTGEVEFQLQGMVNVP